MFKVNTKFYHMFAFFKYIYILLPLSYDLHITSYFSNEYIQLFYHARVRFKVLYNSI